MPNWLVKICNWVNDSDLTWLGFQSLRPALHENMSPRVVIRFCLVYCPLSAIMVFCIVLVWLSAIDPAVQAALAPFTQLASKVVGR